MAKERLDVAVTAAAVFWTMQFLSSGPITYLCFRNISVFYSTKAGF